MNIPLCCDSCERKPATCFGVYEVELDAAPSFCCDDCCGHGNEDGWCKPIAEYDLFLAEAFAELSKFREANWESVFREHTKAVGEFLNELYAVMVDPCAEGTLSVDEMKAALLAAAMETRERPGPGDLWILEHQILPNVYGLKYAALRRVVDKLKGAAAGFDRVSRSQAPHEGSATTTEAASRAEDTTR